MRATRVAVRRASSRSMLLPVCGCPCAAAAACPGQPCLGWQGRERGVCCVDGLPLLPLLPTLRKTLSKPRHLMRCINEAPPASSRSRRESRQARGAGGRRRGRDLARETAGLPAGVVTLPGQCGSISSDL